MKKPSSYRLIQHAIEIFDQLPGKQGCDKSLLRAANVRFGGEFPPLYSRLMLSDARRMAATLELVHPAKLVETRQAIDELLVDPSEGYAFRLSETHVVIASDEAGFYYFDACGSDLTPVNFFDTETENEVPKTYASTFLDFMALRIRQYLHLRH